MRPKCLAERSKRAVVVRKDDVGVFPTLREMVRRGRRAQEDVDEILRKHDADERAKQDEIVGRFVQQGEVRAALDALAGPPLGERDRYDRNPFVHYGPRCQCGWPIPLVQFRLLAREDIAIKYELRFPCPCCGYIFIRKHELDDLGKVEPGGEPPKGLPPGR